MTDKEVGLLRSLNYHSIHGACIRGDKGQLKQLLTTSDLNILELKDSSGKTPLIYTTIGNHVECISFLLKVGARVDNADHSGQTALHWAAYKGHGQIVKLLLDKGALWYQKDLDGVTPLHLAAIHKSSKCLQLLLQAGSNYTNYDLWDSAKRTALHWSASVANYEHMKLLLKKDANVNIPDVEGRTPLHWVASCNSPRALDCVKLLLGNSPNVLQWQDYQGKTALHLAVIMGTKEVMDALTVHGKFLNLQDNMFRTPLHWAALMGLSEKAKILLDRGPDVNARDANGATPLHYAAQGDHSDTVGVFLSRKSGSDGSLVDEEVDNCGCSALLWAAAKGADSVLRIMQQHGADLNALDKNNNTALHAASLQGHTKTVEWLIEEGCQLDVKNSDGQTPLLLACQLGRAKILRILLSKGKADFHTVDCKGRTTLHCAAIGGHALVCQLLLQYGIEVNLKDYYGLTPLHYASYKGHLNCISVLIQSGANPNSADYLGQTAIHWACLKGKTETVKLLFEAGAHLNSLSCNIDRSTPLDYALQTGHNSLFEYLREKNAISSEVILNLAALVIQAFFKSCRSGKWNQKLEIALDPKWIINKMPSMIRPVATSPVPFNSYQSSQSQSNEQHVKATPRSHKLPTLERRSQVRKLWNTQSNLPLNNIIYVSKIDHIRNGSPMDIYGHCLGCQMDVVIKSPLITDLQDKELQKYVYSSPNTMNLRTLAAVVIQRAWKRYIWRKNRQCT